MSDAGVLALLDTFSVDGDEQQLRGHLQRHTCKSLRTTCTRLQIRPQSRKHTHANNKAGYVDLLCHYWRDRSSHSDEPKEASSPSVATLPTRPRPIATTTNLQNSMIRPSSGLQATGIFRLLNVLFGDGFVTRLQHIEANAESSDLSVFWKDVERAFNSPNEVFDAFVVERPEFRRYRPAETTPADAKRLRGMWEDLKARYDAAVQDARLAESDSAFVDSWQGRADTLYLRDWLIRRRGVELHFEPRLPKEGHCGRSTSTESGDSSDDSTQSEEESTRPRKRTKRGEQTTQTPSVMASSLEKAKVVKEWASAAEILSRVDGSSASVEAIRAIIDDVVQKAARELRGNETT
ncbi:hypothetical protein PHYBOEH_003642 [Phytophthora boehmeriae]|uniref:Uncharacterized protein n=1 Tax=Phytophthora boehmeriae TaxID=109152 RepID=A0A8T1WUJ5_9STRA|nr:hypothetical protein PHYBOEH_003642 [Phytophthora boehmeriae]